MPKVTQTLRTRNTAKLIVSISGDGTPHGTVLGFEGEAPGTISKITIVLDSTQPDEMARGEIEYLTPEGTAGLIECWVRFEK